MRTANARRIGRGNFDVNAVITHKAGAEYVTYTCPECGQRNNQLWYGREDHHCIACGHATNLKGSTTAAAA